MSYEDEYSRREKQEDEARARARAKARARRRLAGGILLVVLLGLIGVTTYGLAYKYLIAEPQYSRVIGDYVLNAEDSANLEGWATYLPQVISAMHNQSLTPDLYNTPFGWQQTPQNRMNFQYFYVQQIINRTALYIQQAKTQSISQFSDVYNTWLGNLRNESNRNGPMDWVAHDAWLLKYYPEAYWVAIWGWATIPGAIVAAILVVAAFSYEED